MSPTGRTRDANAPLDKDDLAHFEKRLLEERKRLLRELGRFDEQFSTGESDSDGELTHYPLHQADQGTDTMEQEKNFLLASQEGRQVWEIDDALRRLYRTPEKYGVCEQCGETISFERLDALPQARTCAKCAQQAEGGSGSR